MILIFELLAFAVSVIAFAYGAFHLFRKGEPKYFQLYVCATGCYMLEELWSIVQLLFGSSESDGLLTVRLLGFFGCLCFMLSANANEFDKVVEEQKSRRARLFALAAPILLLGSYAIYAFSPANTSPAGPIIVGLVSISPALGGAYFSTKHLLLPKDGMGLLKTTNRIDAVALAFYAANYGYPLLYLHTSEMVMSICDVILAGMLFAVTVLCKKGAAKWKTFI